MNSQRNPNAALDQLPAQFTNALVGIQQHRDITGPNARLAIIEQRDHIVGAAGQHHLVANWLGIARRGQVAQA